MGFSEEIAALPFSPSTEHGRGFFPPFMRAGGHLLYLLGRLTDTPTRRPTDNQIRQELDSLKLHFQNFVVPEHMSAQARTNVEAYQRAFNALDTEIEGWDMEAKVANILMLSNRLMQLMAFLDREALGLRDSDAGQEL